MVAGLTSSDVEGNTHHMNEDFVELVLTAVEEIPSGEVASYGDIAEKVGRGGPRQVGQVMSSHGAAVPWWRVVRADGRPAHGLEQEAIARLSAEGVPLHGERVDMLRARSRLISDLDRKILTHEFPTGPNV
jgi:alkylated DNA nucleotide flippase Atl1